MEETECMIFLYLSYAACIFHNVDTKAKTNTTGY